MIVFPNAKINLGLHITAKRPDGFHNIETVFYPIGWQDVLEVVENRQSTKAFELHTSGISISGALEDNLLYKAWQLINHTHLLPNIAVYLHKVIPMGAGLGGGSADAAFFINLLNQQFNLQLSEALRLNMARQLGADCAFFINNTPVYATEKGDVFSPSTVSLDGYHLAVIWPGVHSNTKEAYSLVKPQATTPLNKLLQDQDPAHWKAFLKNDFEASIFSKYPIVETVKQTLYNQGALYACMSGSGSAVFGIFEKEPKLGELEQYLHWKGRM